MTILSSRRALRRLVTGLCLALAAGVGPATSSPATATTGDVGLAGPSTVGAGTAPTGQKPESKLWWNDGRWWASMFDSASGSWHVFGLDRSTHPQSWVDTGTVLDPRPSSRADALWDGTHLYVASHIGATSNTTASAGQPARLYRYSYDTGTHRYTLDSGFPTTISDYSSETLTIDEDSAGRVWATWTQGQAVYVSATTDGYGTWGQPFKLPMASATTVDADDISTLVAFAGRVGVMWSNQTESTVYFSYHDDAAPDGTWSAPEAVSVPGPKQADDHLNIKSLQADSSGRIFAVVKTSLDEMPGTSAAPQIVVLARRPGTSAWDRTTFGTVSDCHTRPVLMIDSANALLRVFATAPDSGCPFTGTAGTIFEKTSPIDSLSFPAGRGTAVMRNAASANLNNVSGTKQSVTAASGLVMLASDDVAKRYWSSDESLATPAASFTASPTSGTAPLTVQFTDTSTGAPTSWRWDFGDGSEVATTQNASHVYSTPGTYTVSLTAANGLGSDTATRTGLVQVGAPPAAPAVTAGSSSSASSTAPVSTVTLGSPERASGDVLVAQFTADHTPSVSAVPSGWSLVPGLKGLSIGSGARVFAYYHVVSDAATEPTSWTWRLSSSEKWGGGMTVFHGADPAQPFLSTATSAVDASYTARSLSIPAVTTTADGSMLVGGIGTDSSSLSPTPPAGWRQAWSIGVQYSGLGYAAQATQGSSGTATWQLGVDRGVAGWMSALRPAG